MILRKIKRFVHNTFILYLLLISSSCTDFTGDKNITKLKKKYTINSILEDLDESGKKHYKVFPRYDNEFYNTCSNKIELYADSENWAIVFQELIYNISENCFQINIDYFGNCLKNMDVLNQKDTSNSKRIQLNNENDLIPVFEKYPFVSKNIQTINIRNKPFKITHDKTLYLNKNITPYPSDNGLIDIKSIFRYLIEENKNAFWATNEEIKLCIPKELPLLMVIDKWYHEPYDGKKNGSFSGVPPSQYETFQQIAKVLVTKDTSFFNPTIVPNNDWRNWEW